VCGGALGQTENSHHRDVRQRPRIEESGCFYHLTTNGNNRGAIFRDDIDREDFLLLLARVARRYGWSVFAYCLMTTHYHLVLAIGDAGFSAGMRDLNGGHSLHVNRRHGREGHLLRNRFHSEPIEDEAHLLQACRYDVLNPVAAGICAHPRVHLWSSYLATLGRVLAPPFLAVDELLRLFAPSPVTARRLYGAFVAEGVADARAAAARASTAR
jgi:REP-associated tyrosine transposase